MEKTLSLYSHSNLVTNYVIREEEYQGRTHIVVPVIMMVEGVHNGSMGPILYTTEELAKSPSSWDGVPVTIAHPQDDDGGNTSANIPEVLTVGRVFNSYMDGDKLKAEVWVDLDLLKDQSSDALDYIQGQRPLDVSVGVFTNEEEESGEWNGESYRAIARVLRPDHLALLPNEQGACSWDDGCGIRNNKEKEIEDKTKGNGGPTNNEGMKKTKEELIAFGYGIDLTTNETGFREIGQKLQGLLDALDSDSRMYFLEEIFDDNFIYRVSNRETNTSAFYKRSYSVNAGSDVEMDDDAVEVRKQVTFEVMKEQKLTRNKFSNKNKRSMKKNEKGTPCKIDALIANEASRFEEGDREWLGALEDSVLDKLTPKVVEPKLEVNKDPKKSETSKKETPEVINEDAVKKILSNQKDPISFIDNFMPEGLKDQMKSGLKMYQEKRAQLIKSITDNSNFTEEKLKSWETEDLETLKESVVTDADYSVFGSRSLVPKTEDGEMKSMLHLNEEGK